MNCFTRSILQVFKRAVKAFTAFPAAIVCAFLFAVVTMIRIQLDWPEQEAYNFLFNCLHWAFAAGAVFSLAAITEAKSRFDRNSAVLIANLLGAAAVIVTFLSLYFFGKSAIAVSRAAAVSELAAARVIAVITVSFLAFILLAGYPKERSDFARSLFMVQKAFFIALIYGAVIAAGASGVARAIQSLLYQGMSGKVYLYILTLAGFLAFTIFVGYFPDFRKGQIDEHRETAQKQPRFIEILFGYILIPIVLALTVVLLLWAGRTVLGGTGTAFTMLAGIAAAYTIGGIWLYMMVSHHDSGPAKFYRRVYPVAALVILAFEAWAFVIQLNQSGLKTTEYFFILIWILAAAAAVLLMIIKAKAYTAIVILTCALAAFSVLPAVGYKELPVSVQVGRLENLLVSQGMLEDNRLIPAATEPELSVREKITDSVSFLAGTEDAKLPVWFDKELSDSSVFKTKLGFEQAFMKSQNVGPLGQTGTALTLPNEAIDISDYRWAVQMQNYENVKGDATVTVNGEKGVYTISWSAAASVNGTPTLIIKRDGHVILKQSMNDYIDQITAAFPPGRSDSAKATAKDMSLQLDTPDVTVLLVFSNININVDPSQDTVSYWLNLNVLYLKEK